MELEDFKSVWDILANKLPSDQQKQFDRTNFYSNTPLVDCILSNDIERATHLLNSGLYDPDFVEEHTYLTVLHNAAQVLDSEFLNLLVSVFKNQINSKDADGNRPLHYAAFYRNRAYWEILINSGAKVDAQNDTK